jgi:XTP/dITP diphosphohydrolase
MHRRITGKLVIATHNSGKLAEMRELLAPYGIEAVSAGELDLPEPEETGNSFRRPSPMIPAWWSMRSTARPESFRRAGPDPTRISPAR